MNRRKFLKSSGASVAAFTILQAGSARTYAANEKLNIAAIAAGGKAVSGIAGLASENFVALADVDWARAAGTFRKYPKAPRFKDYREMLDKHGKEIDAVIISTPDHHHFHASMTAIRMGKHVYCEKPLTHSIWEARTLTEAARKAGVATQMGNQAQANEQTRVVQEYVMDGAVGQVREAHIWTDRPAKGLFGSIGRRALGDRRTNRKFPTPWTGICGSGRRRSGPIIRPTRRVSGAVGGTLARAPWATLPVTSLIRFSAR